MSSSQSFQSISFLSQYKQLSLLDSCMPDLSVPNPALKEIWELDQKIRTEFSHAIQMYEQGLITSIELYTQLAYILNRDRRNG